MTANRKCSYRRRTFSRLLASFIWFLLLVLVVVPSRALAQSAAEARRLNEEALALYEAGKFSQAEPLFRRSLAIREKVLGPEHQNVATSLNNLAELYRDQGKYVEAEPLYRRSRAIWEKVLGPEHPNVAQSLNNLAALYRDQGKYAEAEPLYRRSLAIREKVLGPEHPDVAQSLNNLAELYRAQGKYAEAEPLHRRSLAIWEKVLGPEHPNVATSLNNLAGLYETQGQYAQAEPLHRRSLAISEKALGPEHPNVADSLNNLAYMLAQQRKLVPARPLYECARRIQLAIARVNVELDEEALGGLLKTGRAALQYYAGLLANIAQEPKLDPSPGSAEKDAFVVAEQVRSGTAQAALARSSARVAAGDPATASLARQVQELRNQRQVAGKQLIEEYGKPTQQRNAQRLEALQKETQKLERELTDAVKRLNKAFPKYAELASPEPIDVTALNKILRADEALLSLFTLNDRLLVWLVRRGKEVVYKDIEIKRADLSKLAARVRASLDQSANPNLAVGELLPFDVAGSHELFKLLIAPFRDQLSGVKHMIFVPDELLLPIPFGALVTRAEGEPYRTLVDLYEKKLSPSVAQLADYAKLSWLAKDYAITVLPSATSLRALRQIARSSSTDVEPFIGFGDPALRGRGTRRGGTMLASRGTNVSVDEIRQLDRLPGTRDELIAIAKALGADPGKVLYLDKQATKPMVMSLNSSGRLGKARVVSFATHGLIAGEVSGLKEPALVLTPPERPSEKDNGLLGLEDILSLKLANAYWVILSACNTAAADGSSEGLSGLVRAFFFTGTPSLLVSHWGVDDRATQALMIEVFRRYARDKTVARSEALRQGMLALMSSAKGNTAYFAHPFAWAPFFLVGEGGGGSN